MQGHGNIHDQSGLVISILVGDRSKKKRGDIQGSNM